MACNATHNITYLELILVHTTHIQINRSAL